MKKFLLMIITMFLCSNYVFALEDVVIDIISVSNDSVTLEVMVSEYEQGNICYLYRSTDSVSYENQMIIDCNMMYVDKNIENGMTYYYKARYGNNDQYSEEVKVIVDDADRDVLKLTRDVRYILDSGLGFITIFGLVMIVLVIGMFLFKKKLV